MVSSPTVGMGVKVSPKIQLGDTASLVDPSQWYDASQHIDWWVDFGRQWQGPTDLYGIDLFGGLHGRVQQAFQKRGFRCGCYDIARKGIDNDITSYGGFRYLVLLGLRLQHGSSLIMMGPPCSLFVWLSSSVHWRSLFGPAGDPNHVGTQMANAIARNTVLWLMISISSHVFFFLHFFERILPSQFVISHKGCHGDPWLGLLDKKLGVLMVNFVVIWWILFQAYQEF